MTSAPELFDRAALARHRARSRDDALFLHRAALDEVQDRLALVNRTFTDTVIVSPFPQIWRPVFPAARIVPDENLLPLEPESCDLVVHAMSLHWANDPVGQLIQCRRALRPDGLFLGLLLAGNTLAELRAALAEAETRVSGGISPRVAPMAELRDLGGLLQRAGFALPVADSIPLAAAYRDLAHLMHDLRGMGETNALAGRLRRPARRALFAEAERVYSRHFRTAEGLLRATFELVCLTGWAPDPGQPRPLRPGSAKVRLADALGAREKPLSD